MVASANENQSKPLSEADRFSCVLGTQTIGASYGFTDEPRLVETANAILAMGSNVLKTSMGKEPSTAAGIRTLTDMARDDPAHRRVLDMPFAYYILWAYPFSAGSWRNGLSAADRDAEYREMHDFARYLLTIYSGTGKTFYIGHWEGDWHLRPGYNVATDEGVTPAAVQGMIDWLNTRQKAIDDAKRDTPHHDVQIYHYTEVNLVRIAQDRRPTLTNSVLPKTNIDYVSYSSYDTESEPEMLKAALGYIESKLPAKAGIPGKRVWIGEYGFPALGITPEEQDRRARQVMRAGLEWGCPFVLYWEMYNNEVDKDGKQRGFWLIDDHNVKQPVYHTLERYYRDARRWVSDFRKRNHRLPSSEEFRPAALRLLG